MVGSTKIRLTNPAYVKPGLARDRPYSPIVGIGAFFGLLAFVTIASIRGEIWQFQPVVPIPMVALYELLTVLALCYFRRELKIGATR